MGVASVKHFITGHEQTQVNRVCYFHCKTKTIDICYKNTFFE